MALPKKDEFNPLVNLPGETMIEVAFVNGERIMKTTMTFRESYYLKVNKDWKKTNYQLGQCFMVETETFDKNKIIIK